jgi:hypothetical protein
LGGSPGVAYFTPCQDTATGTTALPPGAGAALFPNPTGRHAELRLDWPERTPLALSLFDATGRILRQWNDWTAAPGSNRFALDFDGIAPGMYILRIRTGAGSEMPLRIVVAP